MQTSPPRSFSTLPKSCPLSPGAVGLTRLGTLSKGTLKPLIHQEPLNAVVKAERIGALALIPFVANGALIGKLMMYQDVFCGADVKLALATTQHMLKEHGDSRAGCAAAGPRKSMDSSGGRRAGRSSVG
jgi:hypothetical protein